MWWRSALCVALAAVALQLLPLLLSLLAGGWVQVYTHNPHGFRLGDIPDLTGRVAVVTGATRGLGFVIATELARNGASVILGARSKSNGLQALQRIQAEVGDAHLEVAELDLASLASVRAFAAAFRAARRPLHLLVLNAGVAYTDYIETVDGFEQHIGVNHLGHFLLTQLLLDPLIQSAPSRVVAVTSGLHRTPYEPTGIRFESFRSPEGYDRAAAYGQSKLANILMVAELARRLDGRRVFCNAAHPGMVQTDIWYEGDSAPHWVGPVLRWVFEWIVEPSLMSVQDGALTPLYAATHPDVEVRQISGQYFVPVAQQKPPSHHAQNTTLQRLLWDHSERLTSGEGANQ
eukprot:EG_transcript_18234